jgi:hypothetical protein
MFRARDHWPLWMLTAAVLFLFAGGRGSAQEIEFNRDIRPILSNNCFVCHGPDNNLRKADLRLDLAKEAFADRGGYYVLVPGKPDDSELFKRLVHDQKLKRMPPAKTEKTLTKDQIALIRRWIEQGAKYQEHWSLIAAKRRATPEVTDAAWARNALDRFILARLEKEELKPSPEADRRTLIRRLSFDLTGLPPTPAEVDRFLRDSLAKPQTAYEELVDRLLASQHYGERMALYWLDLVRYADTGGYHSDNHRDVWLYRDYVIGAFNDNLPFDRFTIEQVAGDLLPNATREQKIASGYNRLLQTTEEGGAQPKEYQAKYYADRVRNASTVWLGLTLGCSECHDHKFDPFTTKEFYQFASFFADLQERSVGRQEQTPMPMPAQAEQLRKLDQAMEPLTQRLAKLAPELEKSQRIWEQEMQAKGLKTLPKEIVAALKIEPVKRNAQQKSLLTAHYQSIDPTSAATAKELADLKRQKDELVKTIPTTLVSISGTPRTLRVLRRGNWLDDSGEVVNPGLPAALPKLEVGNRRLTRLDMAKWLVSPDNPLTARVFVNRLWMLMFGQGIVKTLDDFGNQGLTPSHPELLDWLAVEFRESGWNVKHMIKLLVTSNAYRQTSKVSDALKQRDPYNALLARQARFRLDAEMVRDNALAVSGLLVRKVGGPSVKPYQPAGYWRYLNFPVREWYADKGPDQYRRGLYTYWQRTFVHPSLLAFDASTREECAVDRPRSNIPQQALVLLNDPTYVEAARALAEHMVREGGKDVDGRIHFAYRRVLGRKAEPAEIDLLSSLYSKHFAHYRVEAEDAKLLLSVGDRPAPADIPAGELAAWTSVARAILNLHETITRN